MCTCDNKDITCQDCSLKYDPDVCNEIVSKIESLKDKLICEEVLNNENIVNKLGNLLEKRLGSEIVKYCILNYLSSNRIDVEELEAVIELNNLSYSINDLIKLGLVYRIDLNTIYIPMYTTYLLATYCKELKHEINLEEIIDLISNDYTALTTLETALFNIKPNIEFINKLLGVNYEEYIKSFKIDKVVKYVPNLDKFIYNPIINIDEFKVLFNNFKRSKAKSIYRKIEIPGHTQYSKSIRCLIVTSMISEKIHGLVIYCPWLVPTKKFERYYSNVPRLVILGLPLQKDFIEYYHEYLSTLTTFRKTAFAFLSEGSIYLLKPEQLDKGLESLIDYLYSTEFEVIEL